MTEGPQGCRKLSTTTCQQVTTILRGLYGFNTPVKLPVSQLPIGQWRSEKFFIRGLVCILCNSNIMSCRPKILKITENNTVLREFFLP